GVNNVLLFGIPEHKDHMGTDAVNDNGIIQKAIREIKKHTPKMNVITDVCYCEYTDHGHCGFLTKEGEIDNDKTLEMLAEEALSHVKAGADMVAPSDMMDGRIAEIRESLDESGYQDIPIMAYSVKYSSAFYGPFRDAAQSTPSFGDRNGYQMDPANSREAIREAYLDIEENADIIMVKPALPYLDIIRMLRDNFDVPIAAYNVSGEFSMVAAAAEKGWLDFDRTMEEMLLSIKRAGADIIISYFTKPLAKKLATGKS
ncbi:MAG: porphobilinogen synthase, partial [Nitrospinae bacterium]|nr:porphobilinogen synthase [Nitrospinota bacterium]